MPIEIESPEQLGYSAITNSTYVGPGYLFEVSDRYFRLGYGWPSPAELRDGLAGLTAAAGATLTAG